MNKEEFIQQCSDYAAGELTGEELKRFVEYLRTASTEEREQLAELVSTVSLLPLALDQKVPPPRVKEELMQKIHISARAREAASRRTADLSASVPAQRRNWMPFGIATALGMIALFSVFAWRLLNTIDEQNKKLVSVQNEHQQLQTQLVALKDELTRKEELLKVLASKRIEITGSREEDSNPPSLEPSARTV
ncbi:MAG: hypothetical protein HW412_1708 [Bacteroidetes bacterium]|nr:hypothetical protein [Bacteroidota bacterium]